MTQHEVCPLFSLEGSYPLDGSVHITRIEQRNPFRAQDAGNQEATEHRNKPRSKRG